MRAVDWLHELQLRDNSGLIGPEDQEFAVTKAKDALDIIQATYPVAYQRFDGGGANAVIGLVCDAVFRVFRDAEADGITSEKDGVYSYSTSYGSQSSDIYFPKGAKDTLASLDKGLYAYGSFYRGGI